jgi:DNA-binding transcriptional regulator WhiA
MLVASELKGELARIQPARACCRRAELAGLLYARAGVSTLDHATARVAVQLAGSMGLAAAPRRRPGPQAASPGRHHLEVALDPRIASGWSWASAPAHDRRAFLRGVLLGGSISMAAGGSHVEFTLRSRPAASQLHARLRDSRVRAGLTERRGRHVVYIKGQEEIATLLRLAGANRALLDLEASRVARDVRNRLNRLLNAEEANLGRTVRAADRQLQAIRRLESAGELERLSDTLRETAAARRAHPEGDLDAIASVLGVSRSAANHRLRRLVALAEAMDGSRDPS